MNNRSSEGGSEDFNTTNPDVLVNIAKRYGNIILSEESSSLTEGGKYRIP